MKSVKQRLAKIEEAFIREGCSVDTNMTGSKILGRLYLDGCEASIEYDSDLYTECIWVDCLETNLYERGNGAATRLLNIVFKLGDSLKMPVMLEAVPIGSDIRMTVNQLISWYERRGFVQVKHSGHSCEMMRNFRVLTQV